MLKPVIRPATSEDLAGVLALYRQLNPDDPALDVAGAAPVWSAVLGSGLTTPFVAEIEGRLVSSCTLAIVPNLSRGARPYGVIENVVTDAGHRRSGLGGIDIQRSQIMVAARCTKPRKWMALRS